MGTRLIKPKKRQNHKLTTLNVNERKFLDELLASDIFSPTDAARKVGYKNPSQDANRLMKKPAIAEALGKRMRERSERCHLKADDVLNFLRAALFFNPLTYFHPGDNGGWFITDPDSLPEEVGRLIDSIDVHSTENPDGSKTHKLKVKLINKARALELALRHLGLLSDKLDISVMQPVDMSKLWIKDKEIGKDVEDTAQKAIEDLRSRKEKKK